MKQGKGDEGTGVDWIGKESRGRASKSPGVVTKRPDEAADGNGMDRNGTESMGQDRKGKDSF
jgi:hypothetical protein